MSGGRLLRFCNGCNHYHPRRPCGGALTGDELRGADLATLDAMIADTGYRPTHVVILDNDRGVVACEATPEDGGTDAH